MLLSVEVYVMLILTKTRYAANYDFGNARKGKFGGHCGVDYDHSLRHHTEAQIHFLLSCPLIYYRRNTVTSPAYCKFTLPDQ